MRDGQLSSVDPGLQVLPAELGQRPFDRATVRRSQKYVERAAILARTFAGGRLNRPVLSLADRAGQPGSEPARAVFGQRDEASVTGCVELRYPGGGPKNGDLQHHGA